MTVKKREIERDLFRDLGGEVEKMERESRRINRSKALGLLKELTQQISDLMTLDYDNSEAKPWKIRVESLLRRAFDAEDFEKLKNVDLWSDMALMGDEVHQRNYEHNLTGLETVLKAIIDKYEILDIEKVPAINKVENKLKSPIQLFDAMQFHARVVKASKPLFTDGHYAPAVFEAFKAVENFIKEKSGSPLYGKQLMAAVFSEDNPIIKVPEAGYFDRDVQEGFKFLFMGASQGIRNPKAHKEIVQKDPYITLEYLGFASFLLKRIDYWEAGTT